LINWVEDLDSKCPEWNYSFSDKERFHEVLSVGGIIQYPLCETELIVNNNLQLEV
jgi:hypothetical protein